MRRHHRTFVEVLHLVSAGTYTEGAGDTNASPSPDICRGIAFGKCWHIHRGMREIQMRRHLRTFVEVLHLVSAGIYTEGCGRYKCVAITGHLSRYCIW